MDTSYHVLDTLPFAIATATGYVVFAEGMRLCASSGFQLVLQGRNKLFTLVQRRRQALKWHLEFRSLTCESKPQLLPPPRSPL